MTFVRPKKHLGQHFLKDENIACKIVDSLDEKSVNILEIGAGMGVLTKYLIQKPDKNLFVIDIDRESIDYMKQHYPQLGDHLILGDCLQYNLHNLFSDSFSIIGNFPYNISSQILFKVLEYKDQIPEVIGMFQNEVALRIAAKSGSKTYGILSVLLQAFYEIEYLFKVDETVFVPPPKVKSAVIRLRRNEVLSLDCDEKLFKQIVKTAFNQRRKTLRNALKSIAIDNEYTSGELFNKRAEQLNVSDFIEITKHATKI
ncbi:MAG: 16S rRNA (adenine(1518)-N(6)/adenine(1519)-N(6))-dimethyltransferase [Bacteroidetes bacterium CG2_30_32_10]|nr:MAG: 16S rRNA (adenine(1518)-N(6)/adenine(1519)-N(6))-dimethyltransferase [Bacteroidetes bacterium CG2_30_32_10]